MATTTCEVTWLLYLLGDLHIPHERLVLLYCDNQAAVHISANPVFHERSKHIEADCLVVRNRALDGRIKMFYVSSRNQLADIFTKALVVDQFSKLLARLGVINIFAHNIPYPEYQRHNPDTRALLLRGSVKIAQQDGVLHQGEVHLANQVRLQLPGDEASDQTVAMTVIEAMPYYDHML